jgi:RHS repeat-associated protein
MIRCETYPANGNHNTAGYTVGTGNQISTDPAGNTFNYLGGNLGTKTDSSGNVWTYTFDFHNRLTQVVEKNSGGTTLLTESMTYDVFGNLISTKLNGTVQRWTIWDGSSPYIDFNGSGTLTQRYLMNPNALDQFFAIVGASGSVNWLLTDNLGSIREVVSKTGTVLDQITYGAFGNILSQTNSSNAPRYLYAGGEWDGNLGLYHFGARWDDPVDGRWISQDPLGLGPDSDPYRYVSNRPTVGRDPTGLQAGGQESEAAPFPTPGWPFFDPFAALGIGSVGRIGSSRDFLLPAFNPILFPPPLGTWIRLPNGSVVHWEGPLTELPLGWDEGPRLLYPADFGPPGSIPSYPGDPFRYIPPPFLPWQRPHDGPLFERGRFSFDFWDTNPATELYPPDYENPRSRFPISGGLQGWWHR